MRDPYEVLGVPRTATQDEIKAAYRALAKKYHPDQYAGSPLADVANEKMQEVNEAYDAIISGAASGGAYQNRSYGTNGTFNDFSTVRSFVSLGRVDEAESILEQIDTHSRDAEWYFLKGQCNYQRGWLDQAYTYFTTAHNMDPQNADYNRMYESIRKQRAGGFRTSERTGGGMDVCSVCQGLLCADCCCECMGGDLIPCC